MQQEVDLRRCSRSVRTYLTINLVMPKTLTAFIDACRAARQDAVQAQEEIETLRARDDALTAKMDRVFLQFDGEDAERLVSKIKVERDEARARVAHLEDALEPVDFTPDEIEGALTDVLADVYTPEGLKRAARVLGLQVLITQDSRERSVSRVRCPWPTFDTIALHGCNLARRGRGPARLGGTDPRRRGRGRPAAGGGP